MAANARVIAEEKALHAGFVLVYLLALIAVGAVKARSIRSQADFSLAGRGLSSLVLIGTLLATWIGTGSIFGNAEETVRVGVDAFFLPLAGGLGICVLIALAARIRRFGQFTIQDILEARFGVAARVLGTLTLVVAYVIIVSYQYRAGAAVLRYLFPDLPEFGAVCLVAFFVILYTALAGMISVAYTDVANGILMIAGLALALPILLDQTGGFGAAVASLPAPNRELFGHYGAAELLSVTLPAFLLIIGDANMVQRFFSASSEQAARRSAVGMLIGVLALEFVIITVALLGAALVAQGGVVPLEDPGHVVVHLAFEALPPWLGAALLGTVVAVVVSTADSYLLSPATSLVRDAYQRFLEPDASERDLVRAGRLVVIGLGLIALYLSTLSDAFFDVALFAYTIYGAGITPALFAAYFWPRATTAGVIASMITGVLVAIGWKTLTSRTDDLAEGGFEGLASLGRWASESGIDAVIPAILLAVCVLVAVSLATPAPPSERARAF